MCFILFSTHSFSLLSLCRFAQFLLQIHDYELHGAEYVEDKPSLFVMSQSGADSEPFIFLDFTEYIIKTVYEQKHPIICSHEVAF
jgi:hypothetical protein